MCLAINQYLRKVPRRKREEETACEAREWIRREQFLALVHEGTIDHLSEAGLIALDETGVQKVKYKRKIFEK